MKSGMQALVYSVRLTVVLKFFGQLNFGLAALTLVPLAVSIISGDYAISIRYMAVIGLFFFIGNGFSRFRAPRRIQTNEAMVVTAIAFFSVLLSCLTR